MTWACFAAAWLSMCDCWMSSEPAGLAGWRAEGGQESGPFPPT